MKIRRLLGAVALFVAYSLTTHAQPITPMPLPAIDAYRNPQWVVKFAPLSLLDPSNTIQFGLERMIGEHQSIQIEVGYGWQGMNLWQSSQSSRYSDTENWRGRAEWRYYWRGGPIGSYIAVEGLYKQVTAQENGTIGIGCDTGPCQYYQLFSSPISKHVWGGHLKFGRQLALSSNNRLVADFYGGLGIRGNTIERTPRPVGFYYFQPRGFTLFDPFSTTSKTLISISYGLKVGYAF
jgi:hypothetical protein